MNEFVLMVMAAFFSWLITGLVFEYSENYVTGEAAIALMKECEVKLPRDQYCELAAVPAALGGDE